MKTVVRVRGKVAAGLGESSLFTGLAWVRAQFIQKLAIDPFPGTFNLEIEDRDDLDKYRALKSNPGIPIVPAQPGFCPAKAFPVVVNGRLRGAAIIPQVHGYPDNKLEIISSVKIMEALSLKTGDPVIVELEKE